MEVLHLFTHTHTSVLKKLFHFPSVDFSISDTPVSVYREKEYKSTAAKSLQEILRAYFLPNTG